jgi:hypothetical protein
MIPPSGTVNTATADSGLASWYSDTVFASILLEIVTGTTAPFSAISGAFSLTPLAVVADDHLNLMVQQQQLLQHLDLNLKNFFYSFYFSLY